MRAAALASVALLASAFALAAPVRGAVSSLVGAESSPWNDVFGARAKPTAGQRMIVVLTQPSLAARVVEADRLPTPKAQKRWVAQAEASQRLLLARLRARGIELRRARSFTRTLNGFSALLDARAQAELERSKGVAGVYPVRTVYPATISAQTLLRPEFRSGGGRRPDVSLPGFEGGGVRIALLDSGVDLDHAFLDRRVLAGIDLVDRDRRAAAERKPDEPQELESHGTRIAGILVGAGGPGGLKGVAPGARVLPIRVLSWERAADGAYRLLGRGDTLLAGLERAVDPDGDGDVEDAVEVALAALVEPYAAFGDSPEARAVLGATRLGTLVVAASGNDGSAGAGFGTVGGPGGAASALTVGALDARREVLSAHASVVAGTDILLDQRVPVLGAVPPSGSFRAAGLVGPTLADPSRAPSAIADGSALADFFDARGVSRVIGRAVVLPGGSGRLEERVGNAVTAGARAVVVAGADIPAGAVDLDEATAVPVVAVPARAARRALEAYRRGLDVSVSFGAVVPVANELHDSVADFSSGGISFGGHVKPDVVAPGVGIATSDAEASGDEGGRYATASGSSVAAAITAGSAALLAEARPDLSAAELKALLVGTARQLFASGKPVPVTVQGAGALDVGAAAAADVAVEPAGLAFGRASADGWRVTRTLRIRNVSARRLEISFGIARDEAGEPALSFAATPARVSLPAGGSSDVALVASAPGRPRGDAAGVLVVSPRGSRPVRVPWAVAFRGEKPERLLTGVSLSARKLRPSDAAPAVLAFRAGRVRADDDGRTVGAVAVLEAELWTTAGRRLGLLTRLRDLLPGRYAFGVTGRGPDGRKLPPGRYAIRLRARPVAGDTGAAATTVDVRFTIVR